MDETHELLLAIAGRVDDDLLAWARELVAVGEDARAVELVTAGLSADRIALPAAVRAAAVEAATTARIDLDADTALAPATADESETDHRFTACHDDELLTAAVGALPARLLEGARVELTWRLTPAGTAPGPLPHPVLLVEVEPGGRAADVLAYQLHAALDRGGVAASVEVLTVGRPIPAYHAAARSAARSMDDGAELAEPVPLPVATAAPAPREDPADQVPRPVQLRAAPDGGGRRRRAAPEPAPGPAPRTGEQRRPTVTPISRPLPSPVPLLRRESGQTRPLSPVDAPGERTDEQQAVRPAAEGQLPALAETPAYRSMQDPLNGPLHSPLLAPLLDPRPDGEHYDDGYDDEYDQGLEAGPGTPADAFGVSPLAPEGEAPVEDGWAGEWASGDWAVASSDLDDEPEDAPAEPAPAPAPVTSARHRFAGPPQPLLHQPPPPAAVPPAAVPPAPLPMPQRPPREPHHPDLGLRPDSLARLSDADRELLARLQAELGAAGRKPRLTRRAGVVPNGNGRPPNGQV